MGDSLLVKYESKSARVKGLAFHPSRHWLLVSLHTGVVQLLDYRMGTVLEKYEDHEGPVRGVAFHPTQPIFSTGGDDYKVKLWNFKQRKCICTFEGHLDYIRTVTFHHELPWLMSCSDDQTIRIWNWQSRGCIAILTGHNHYIMSALFHPQDDLIISSSLDQTIRVWDYKSLKQKFSASRGQSKSEMFLGTDVVIKFMLEGHERGVNWATFHPSGPYIVSSADDRTVRLWRYTDTKAWEVETMRGHSNNVSSVLFHPKLDVIISDSEDKSLKVWDMNRRHTLCTYRRETDRFWTLAAHSQFNLFAAGCDSGVIIFKLEKERVPAVRHRGYTFIVAKKTLKAVDKDGRTSVLATLTPPGKSPVYQNNPSDLHINKLSTSDTSLLALYEQEGGSYFLFTLPKDPTSVTNAAPVQGPGLAACFMGKDKFALLKRTSEVHIMDMQNNSKRKLTLSFTPNGLFYAGVSKLLIRNGDLLVLYDTMMNTVVREVETPQVRRVVWSENMEMVALLAKYSVTLMTKSLDTLCISHRERTGIKSGVWDNVGVFLYNTASQVNYLVPNGDTGLVRGLEAPVYLIAVEGGKLLAADRAGDLAYLEINSVEYRFKLALHNKRYNEVKQILESGGLCGSAIIGYLQDKGFPEVALYFVEDDKMKFNLAIQAGILEIALESAYKLGLPECWERLGTEALRQGSSQIVEMTYQKTRNLDKLSMLYLITGNGMKLAKMQQIAQTRGDQPRLLHNSLYRGDLEKRVELLASAGQVPLAYVMAKVHALVTMLPPLEQSLGPENMQRLDEYVESLGETTLLSPPAAIFNEYNGGDQNWPLHQVITSEFELLKNQTDPANPFAIQPEPTKSQGMDFTDLQVTAGAGGWGDELDFEVAEEPQEPAGAWEGADFEVPDVPEAPAGGAERSVAGAPSQRQKWARSCKLPGELIAAGNFPAAMQALSKLVGIRNFQPLREKFIAIYAGGYTEVPTLPHLSTGLEVTLAKKGGSRPLVCLSLPILATSLKHAYKLTTSADFASALQVFRDIIQSAPLLSVSSEKEETEVRELLKICSEYATCMRLELQRQAEQKTGKVSRMLELSYYMTLCGLQPPHLSLTLRSAISAMYKAKCFVTCVALCKRFLDLAQRFPQVLGKDGAAIVDKHKKLLAYCQQVFTNEVKFSEDLPETAQDIASVLCAHTFTQVGPTVPTSRCPLCGSQFHRAHKGSVCATCEVAEVGAETLGLKVFLSEDR